MNFPVYVKVGSHLLHPHFVFELMGYTVGILLYRPWRRKETLDSRQRLQLIFGALIGAAAGAILLCYFLNPQIWFNRKDDLLGLLLPGKTVVGGLLGGLIGVELTKKRLGLTRSTGDDFVFPVVIGMILGRIGCFLTGLADNTYGNPTSLPWGVNFGDGIPRHPTQIYEILFLVGLVTFLIWRKSKPRENGDLFKIFIICYLIFRFLIDFIKPYPRVFIGLNLIQVAALIGLIYYGKDFHRLFLTKERTYA